MSTNGDAVRCPVVHDVDLLDPEYVHDPYPTLRRWREEGPVVYLPELDHYVITRYADVEQILLDRDTWSAANVSSPLQAPCEAAQAVLRAGYTRIPTLSNADPPRHGPMRKSVLAVMTPRRLRALEPVLRDYARGLVEGFRDQPVVDFVEAFTFPFPGFAGFSLLGFPAGDTDMLKEWSRKRLLLTYGKLADDDQVEAATAMLAMWKYVDDFVARRWAEPVDDLTSDLVRLSGEKPDQLNQFDIVNIVYSMALAGHETTTNTIGNGVLALLLHREQWQRLIEDPGSIENAVEEILRFEGPVVHHRRIAKVATTVGGVELPAGAKVMISFGSGGHDPAEFGDDADEFRIDRSEAELHLAFGKGAHLCLGATLARLEIRLTLELLTTMTPDIELVPDQQIDRIESPLLRGPRTLLVAPQGLGHTAAHLPSGGAG